MSKYLLEEFVNRFLTLDANINVVFNCRFLAMSSEHLRKIKKQRKTAWSNLHKRLIELPDPFEDLLGPPVLAFVKKMANNKQLKSALFNLLTLW